MIEAIIAAVAEVATETAGEVASLGLENSSPLAGSIRPIEGGMELPTLKRSDVLHTTKRFSEVQRPYDSGNIELPKLRTESKIVESKANDGTSGSNHSDVTTRRIPCRNEELAGKEHPVTGVPFERKTVTIDGGKAEVVVPDFDSQFEAQLPEDKLTSSDAVQFKECNSQLSKAVESDSKLKGKFTDEQLEQIANGDSPDGYTWHHDAETGKMQLVDTDIHQQTGHTGGRNIWGGGSNNR